MQTGFKKFLTIAALLLAYSLLELLQNLLSASALPGNSSFWIMQAAGLIKIASSALLLLYCCAVLLRRFRIAANSCLVIGSFFLAVSLAELFLGIADSRKNPRPHLDYGDLFRTERPGSGGDLNPDFEAYLAGGTGNSVHFRTDSHGFRTDKEILPEHDPATIRILSIGDSFATGYRVGQHETYSWLLEQYLNSKGDGFSYQVPIAGINNTAAGLYYLSAYGADFHPDVVLYGLCIGNDIGDAYAALAPGGPYALSDKGTGIQKNPHPAEGYTPELKKLQLPQNCLSPWRKILVPAGQHGMLEDFKTDALASRLFQRFAGEAIVSGFFDWRTPRLFDFCTGLGFFLRDPPPEIQQAYQKFFTTLQGLAQLADRKGFTLILLLFPQRFQVQQEDWAATAGQYGLKQNCFDLQRPTRLIADYCRASNIYCIDTSPALQAAYARSGQSLYLPRGDMHWNAQGHQVVSKAIRDQVYEIVRQSAARK